MKGLINSMMLAAKRYSILDFALLKASLLTVGILLGVYFAPFFASCLAIIWTVAIISYVLIMYKTLSYRK